MFQDLQGDWGCLSAILIYVFRIFGTYSSISYYHKGHDPVGRALMVDDGSRYVLTDKIIS